MEQHNEETSTYRPRTGSLERRKTAAAAKRAEKPADEGEERAPRTRREPSTDEAPAKSSTRRQSFFKDRTPQTEQHEEHFDEKPKRAPRKSYADDTEKPKRRLYSGDNERPPRRRYGEHDGEEKPKRRTNFDSFSKERPRTERRGGTYGERSEKPFARKPYGEKSFGDDKRPFERKPYGEKSFGDKPRRTFGEDKPRSARPYERKPFEKKSYGDDKRPFERKPYGEKSFGDKPRRMFGEDKPRRTFGEDKPRSARPYERKPYGEKSFDDKPRRTFSEDKPRRTFEDRPKRDIRVLERKPRIQVKDPNSPVRLNKFIANSGVCSRREADEYIQNGEITVNGVVITELGTKILVSDDIRWNGERLSGEKKVYVLLNKPKGYVTTVEDPHADKTVMDLIVGACSERVYPVGRLDKNSSGVLLFTNDGELTKQLTHPSYNKRKVYHVVLDKTLKKPDMDKLVSGIELEDGLAVADEVGYANLEDKTEVGVEIHSGRNRIVRRMFEALGYEVKKLDRVYFAGLTKKSLERGKWRILTPKEVNMLKMGAYE